jgi:hypothetical protein
MSRNSTAIIWTPDMISSIRTERASGRKWAWIAYKVGVSLSALKVQRAKWAAEGITFSGYARSRVRRPDVEVAMVRMLQAGRSYEATGLAIGADADTVATWARSLGVISKRAQALQAGAAR